MTETDQRGPLQVDRRSQLLEALRREGTVRVSDLTAELGVTAVTVRRDIARLADEGLVRRVHGGATLVEPAAPAPEPAPVGRNIGMLLPALDRYWPDVVRGAEEAAREQHLQIRLRASSYDAVDERPLLERFVAGGEVAGLLVTPSHEAPTAAATLEWLVATGVPAVLVERQAHIGPHHTPLEAVTTDHALGAAMAVRHLAGLGHRRVGLVTARHSPTSPHVRRGWFEAALELGLTTSRSLDVEVPNVGTAEWEPTVEALIDRCRRTGTTALLVHSDPEAIALVQHCEHRGMSVPGDLSVVAYDDIVAGLFSPPLTAVRPPRRAVGHAAVELLVARMADPHRPAHRVSISPTLLLRGSTAAPA